MKFMGTQTMNNSFPKDIFCYHLDDSSVGSLDDESNVASSPYCSILKKDSRQRDSSHRMSTSQQTCDFHLSPTSEERILIGPPNPYFLQFLLPRTVLPPAFEEDDWRVPAETVLLPLLEETRRYPQDIKEDAKLAVGPPNAYFLQFIRPKTVLPPALEDKMGVPAETVLPPPLEETRRYPQEIKEDARPAMRRTRSLQLPRLPSRTRVVPLRARLEMWPHQLGKPPVRSETVLPPPPEMRYTQAIKEDAKPAMRRTRSFQLPRLLSRTRVVPLRARLEMWQHQLGKPVRALSELRLNPRDHMDCFGANVLNTVMNPPLLNDSGGADYGVSCGANWNEKEGTTSHTSRNSWEVYQPKTTSSAFGIQDWWSFGMQDWWSFENNNAACSSPGTRQNDIKVVSSRSFWPPSTNFTMESCHQTSGEMSGVRHEGTDAKRNPSTKSVFIEWYPSTAITTQPTQEISDEESVCFSQADLD